MPLVAVRILLTLQPVMKEPIPERKKAQDSDEIQGSDHGSKTTSENLSNNHRSTEQRRNVLNIRKAEWKLTSDRLQVEEYLKNQKHTRRVDVITLIFAGLTNLAILGAGIYLTAIGKDIGVLMMGLGGAGGAMSNIHRIGKLGDENKNLDQSNKGENDGR